MFLNKNIKKTVTLTDRINITDKARRASVIKGLVGTCWVVFIYVKESLVVRERR